MFAKIVMGALLWVVPSALLFMVGLLTAADKEYYLLNRERTKKMQGKVRCTYCQLTHDECCSTMMFNPGLMDFVEVCDSCYVHVFDGVIKDTRVKYYPVPGYEVKPSGETEYVSILELMKRYKVPPERCFLYTDHIPLHKVAEIVKDLIPLKVPQSGEYVLPEEQVCQN